MTRFRSDSSTRSSQKLVPGSDAKMMYQVISSAIVNQSPSPNVCIAYHYITNKWIPLPETEEALVEMFERRPEQGKHVRHRKGEGLSYLGIAQVIDLWHFQSCQTGIGLILRKSVPKAAQATLAQPTSIRFERLKSKIEIMPKTIDTSLGRLITGCLTKSRATLLRWGQHRRQLAWDWTASRYISTNMACFATTARPRRS